MNREYMNEHLNMACGVTISECCQSLGIFECKRIDVALKVAQLEGYYGIVALRVTQLEGYYGIVALRVALKVAQLEGYYGIVALRVTQL